MAIQILLINHVSAETLDYWAYLNYETIQHTSIFITFVVTFKLLVTHQVFRYTFLTCCTLELIVGTFTCKYNKDNVACVLVRIITTYATNAYHH